jgi:hypothetical protein
MLEALKTKIFANRFEFEQYQRANLEKRTNK